MRTACKGIPLALVLLASACALLGEVRALDSGKPAALSARSWVYQLQGPDGQDLLLEPLVAYPAELAVVDYSRNGGEDGEFSAAEVRALQRSGKRVLAYMGLGAADVGRFYDRDPQDARSPFSAPEGDRLLGPENEHFPGTFFVKFWLPDWREIVFGDQELPGWVHTGDPQRRNYLERILDAGFDGVYLDDVDAYQQFDRESGDGSRPSAALEMLQLTVELSGWAKARRPGFLVVPQNGEDLLNAALFALDTRDGDHGLSRSELEDAYFGAINGLGVEDLFFKGQAPLDNPFVDDLGPDPRVEDFKFTAANLLAYAERALSLFSVEYLSDANVEGLTRYCRVSLGPYRFQNGAITHDTDAPAITDEELGRLNLVPFQAPSRALDRLPARPTSQVCGR